MDTDLVVRAQNGDEEAFASLALAAGGDLGFESLDELHAEMGDLLAPHELQPATVVVPAWAPPLAPDGQLILFSYPLLVDEGRLSERADELKAALQDEVFVEVHPEDATALGLTDGGRATVRTDAGEAELPVRVSPHIAQGAAFVPFNQPGLAANTILSGSFTTTATLEAVARDVAAQEVPAG